MNDMKELNSTFYFQNNGSSNAGITVRGSRISGYSSTIHDKIVFSYDKVVWYTLKDTACTIKPSERVYFRGIEAYNCMTEDTYNMVQNGQATPYSFFSIGGTDISVHGNIEEMFPKYTSNPYAFAYFFYEQSAITSVKDLKLPNNIGKGAFAYMFARCLNLKDGPVFPSAAMPEYACAHMFEWSGIETMPSLPSMTLNPYCYSYMFSSCSNLKTLSSLPATNIPNYGYQSMFANCSQITTTPDMTHVINVGDYGCQRMFSSCNSLTAPSGLGGVNLGTGAYSYMFAYSYLETPPPVLPATTLANYCYEYMFINNINLQSAPFLPATNIGYTSCYYCMLYGCNKLSYIKCFANPSTDMGSLNLWVSTRISNGTFVKKAGTSWPTAYIPSGWTIQEATS